MKSINRNTVSGFSTNHHLNFKIIEKYQQVPWSFAIYDGIDLESIYVVTPNQMIYWYRKWSSQLTEENRDHLNNPHIPMSWVTKNGILIYDAKEGFVNEPESALL